MKCQWSVEIFRCADLIYLFRTEIPCSIAMFLLSSVERCRSCAFLSTFLLHRTLFPHSISLVFGFIFFFFFSLLSLGCFHLCACGMRETKPTIWEIETNNNKTFNRWNLCNFFIHNLSAVTKKSAIMFKWQPTKMSPRLSNEQVKFMGMHAKRESKIIGKKLVLTWRMNKPIMIRSQFESVAFSMPLFMHSSNYVIKRSCEQTHWTQQKKTHANNKRQGNSAKRHDIRMAMHIFKRSIYERFNHII